MDLQSKTMEFWDKTMDFFAKNERKEGNNADIRTKRNLARQCRTAGLQ